MSRSSQLDNENIIRLVGAIVLVSQDAERYLKFTLPFINSENPSWGDVLRKGEKLKTRTLGHLVGKFVDSCSSESLDLEQHMSYLVDTRNKVVHHFNETYGAQLRAGDIHEVLGSLEATLSDLKSFRSTMEQIALSVFEGLRDVTFGNTQRYEQMAELCASFRAQIAS